MIGWQTDGIPEPLGFRVFIDLRVGKGGIRPKITPKGAIAIACHRRFQHRPPILGAMEVAVAQQGLLRIAKTLYIS